MSEELRAAVETEQWENDENFWDYRDEDVAGVSDAYLDYVATENYYED